MAQIIVPGNAAPGQVLVGTKFSAGTMTENGTVNITPSGSAQSLPAGHIAGGTVAAVVVPVANVLAGTTIAGQGGTMVNQGALNLNPSQSSPISIPAGYYNGSGHVLAAGGKSYATGTLVTTNASFDITGLGFVPSFVMYYLYGATGAYNGGHGTAVLAGDMHAGSGATVNCIWAGSGAGSTCTFGASSVTNLYAGGTSGWNLKWYAFE
jgi:hypothetical protein